MSDLILICESCRQPILGDTGSVYVTYADINAKQAAQAEWRERHPAGTAIDVVELLTLPAEIHWRTGHDRCRGDRDQGCYEIDAPQIATWPQLARWTAHLMGKNWLALSDWDEFLREAAGERLPPGTRPRIRAIAQEAA